LPKAGSVKSLNLHLNVNTKCPHVTSGQDISSVSNHTPRRGRSLAGIYDSNGCVSVVSCVLSGRRLCDELITRPEESYRLWCVAVWDLEISWIKRLSPWLASVHSATEHKHHPL